MNQFSPPIHLGDATAKAPCLHGLGQLDGPFQTAGQQWHKERQQIADAPEPMPPDHLSLADLLQAGCHLRHEGNSDGSHRPGLIHESRDGT